MAFQFRAATPDDIPAIRELIAASVRTLQVEYTPEQRELALVTVFTVDTQLIADGTYLLAFDGNGTLAGCGGWSKRRTLYGGDHQVGAIEPELLNPATDAAKIRAIFVHPAFARQGLGSLILKRAEDAARHAGFQCFEMGSTLAGAPLYSLKGYRKLESIRVPVGEEEGITVVRMVKALSFEPGRTPMRSKDKLGNDRLDDVKQYQDQDDEQDRADTASAIVAKPRAHTSSAETEDQNQNDQKDNHALSAQLELTTQSKMQNSVTT